MDLIMYIYIYIFKYSMALMKCIFYGSYYVYSIGSYEMYMDLYGVISFLYIMMNILDEYWMNNGA